MRPVQQEILKEVLQGERKWYQMGDLDLPKGILLGIKGDI